MLDYWSENIVGGRCIIEHADSAFIVHAAASKHVDLGHACKHLPFHQIGRDGLLFPVEVLHIVSCERLLSHRAPPLCQYLLFTLNGFYTSASYVTVLKFCENGNF